MRWLVLVVLLAVASAAEPPNVIFDTDMGNDIDDALALAMLHALDQRGEMKLVAVTLSKDSPRAAVLCDIINHFYDRSGVSIGVVQNGKTKGDTPMLTVPAAKPYIRRLTSGAEAPDATPMLQKVLREQPDGSVILIQVGFSTNLARLLELDAPLVKRKVKLLSAMAGAFPGKPEYNVKIDIPAAKKVFAEWPTPIVFSGFEVGESLLYPARSIDEDFRWAADHPVVDAYRAYKKMPYDRPTWDLTSVLYAVRPRHDYFDLSPNGHVDVADDGATTFRADPKGNRRHLILRPEQKARVLEALVGLASQPR